MRKGQHPCQAHITPRIFLPLIMFVGLDLNCILYFAWALIVCVMHELTPTHLHLPNSYPTARRRRNHNMVEEGVHRVPTLRNRVVIFCALFIKFPGNIFIFPLLIFDTWFIFDTFHTFFEMNHSLITEFQCPTFPGAGQKVCVGGSCMVFCGV